MLTYDQLILELAAQFYINKDRVTVGWGTPGPDENKDLLKDFPDPDRQWNVYRDEWYNLTEDDRIVWTDKAEEWLSTWRQQYEDLYPLLLNQGKAVFSIAL